MKILVCPDSFKGTLTAPEAAAAMAHGLRSAFPGAEIIMLPVGDGGEGTVSTIVGSPAFSGRVAEVECEVSDPLHRPVKASYHIAGSTALIESAAASGLTLLAPGERDVLKADSYGTGQLIVDALSRGATEFIVCMGGTATCDGGYGAFRAMREHDFSAARFTLLCDVDNPLLGPRGAAPVFGPQKGAGPDSLPLLEDRLERVAREYRETYGRDIGSEPFAGAAGGLAGMLMACYGATPVRGIERVLALLDFSRLAAGASLVVTGEGRADATTLSGKAAKGVLDASRRLGVPVVLVAGRVADRETLLDAGFAQVVQATPDGVDPSGRAAALLERASASLSL